jgi:hypothetical protein
MTTLTVTEAAIIDLQKGKEAMARAAQNFDPKAAGERARGADMLLTADPASSQSIQRVGHA